MLFVELWEMKYSAYLELDRLISSGMELGHSLSLDVYMTYVVHFVLEYSK